MAKRIVVLSDGTGQSVGRNDSNVLRLCKLLDLAEHSGQVAIYDPGIGTHVSLKRIESGLRLSAHLRLADSNPGPLLLRRLRQPFELGFGLGTTANIRQLYVALAQAYEPGDELFFFGFSRGAFTIRALAGLVYRCGILRKESTAHANTALHWYQQHYTALSPSARAAYRAQVDAFRRQHARPCNIRFLGVWDTVKAVGYLRPKNLPHTRHNPIVEHVRHALSLDERRSFYLHTTWGGLHGESRSAVYAPASFDLDSTDSPQGVPQDVQEVWFPGNHADVGGGYGDDGSEAANNALRWMIIEAQRCGLQFDAEQYRALFPDAADQRVNKRHDEMRDGVLRRILWSVAEYTPRKELHNEPPPPHTGWKCTPAGLRPLEGALRDVAAEPVVCIHDSARTAYAKADAPWRSLPQERLRFVTTNALESDSEVRLAGSAPQSA